VATSLAVDFTEKLPMGISVSISPLDNLSTLEAEWRALEIIAKPPFFLSWGWIGTWLQTFVADMQVLRATREGQLVGIAILTRSKQKKLGLVSVDTISLHQTGDPYEDQIWIEYNNILVDPACYEEAHEACIRFIAEQYKPWDVFNVGQVIESNAQQFEKFSSALRSDIWSSACYGVDLGELRTTGKNYLESLSRNTRYQIKRSIRLYGERGELTVEFANSVESALQYFHEIAPYHLERWGNHLSGSGYANPKFISFHENLIVNCWLNQNIDVIKVSVAGKPIAYFYNFVYGNKVYFYLGGSVLESEARLKPGLVGHALCIQHYIENGLDFYDMMGGEHRYKNNLAASHATLYKIRLSKRSLSVVAEHAARRAKNFFSGGLARDADGKE